MGSGVHSMKPLSLVGGGVTKMRAPFASSVVWSTASVAKTLPRCDAAFELHDGVFSAGELNAMPVAGFYLRDERKDVRNSRRFPIEELEKRFGKVFNGTVVMMLAFAHMQGYRDITLYGVDFASPDEVARRAFFMYVMGKIEGMGSTVGISSGSHLVKECPTYQYDDAGDDYLRDIEERAREQMDADERAMDGLKARTAYMRGVIDTLAKTRRA